jgi:uncharacterized membrane protein YoaK (UPF0700 family)
VPATAVLLAACAGATDALAFFGLGKAFAGIVTGNLVTAGYGIATGNPSLVKPTVTAVVGSVIGEITWARLLRRPGAANGLLITELALFLLVLAGWLAVGSHPAGISALALLALVSVALGGQSIWALRIRQTTTYFTGMLTKTVNAAVSSNAGVGTSLRQLGALLAGAILAGAVLHALRPVAPAVPLLLLAAAATVKLLRKSQ